MNVGDIISLSGRVAEFRTASSPNNLFQTELDAPANIIVISSNNTVTPLILGKDRSPPTQLFSALDVGSDGFLSVPNNSSRIEADNATLRPDKYGMDFWESLESQLVTIPKPTATAFQNNFGEFWVYGDWNITGKNSRGGISITFGEEYRPTPRMALLITLLVGPDGIPDGNPETVIIGSPLDNTKNPQTAIGVGLTDITGVVVYQCVGRNLPIFNSYFTYFSDLASSMFSLSRLPISFQPQIQQLLLLRSTPTHMTFAT